MSDPTIVSDSRMMMGKPAAGTDATVDLPSDSPLRRLRSEVVYPTSGWAESEGPCGTRQVVRLEGRR